MPPAPSFRTTVYRPSKSVPMSVSETATKVPRGYLPGQKGLCDLLGDRRGHRPTEAVELVLQDDRHGDLRVVGGGERDEPGVVDVRDRGLGGSRLAGDLDAGYRRRSAGSSLDDELHHLRQLGGRL